jgi:2-haloacid dehalogenase
VPDSAVPSPAVDAVVFDLGGVLLDWDPRYLYRKLIEDPAELAEFLAVVCTGDWHRAHDLGATTLESCRALAREYPQHADLIMAWAERGEEMIAGQIDGTVDVLADLSRAGVPCFALSNMEAETFPLRRDRFAFMRYFDGYVISGIEGVAKPDPAIFELLLTRHGLDPARTAFIDDNPDNIAAAEQLGVRAIRFGDPGQVRGELRALGLPL